MDGRLLGGRYRLLEAHAMGGMASVWRAHDERADQIVAIKRLHPHLIADEGARERFRREASAMEAILHPNVVAVRDVIVDGDEPALVMDFVAGRSIAELAADDHRFDEAEALAIAAAVADGLAAVHERGIVHRDLKPANVLIGDDRVARLTDFGIATGLLDAPAITADDGVVGTLRYLAPERLAGLAATPATDVWGLGTVLYEMLTGVAAFPATTLTARVEAASAVMTRPAGLADPIWSVLARALASDPADRYPDGAAMAADLHRLPGVPAAVQAPADPSAPTELIALPLAAGPVLTGAPGPAETAPATRRAPALPEASASAASSAPSRPSRGSMAMVGVVGALTLALLAAMAAAGPSADESSSAAGTATASPALESTMTPPPEEAAEEGAPAEEDHEESRPGKGKGRDSGNGDKDH